MTLSMVAPYTESSFRVRFYNSAPSDVVLVFKIDN